VSGDWNRGHYWPIFSILRLPVGVTFDVQKYCASDGLAASRPVATSIILMLFCENQVWISSFLDSVLFLKPQRSPNHPKNISACMVDLLHQLVEESGNLGMDIVEVILSQLNRTQKVNYWRSR
jgi:hypothetical protein